ncbi:hypothetical protein BS50DRAFT_361131 [Corynespora cassiicola Philippines]|uniref:Secreted protein n=1 Tax=Corynespora cassiicola Philippines TaxID=1448308 RepID=A0A2T2NSH5_CORCC|nr:hypothetical protein BS50DRAFT_361131 [Corynespora cassiicola Philippines]
MDTIKRTLFFLFPSFLSVWDCISVELSPQPPSLAYGVEKTLFVLYSSAGWCSSRTRPAYDGFLRSPRRPSVAARHQLYLRLDGRGLPGSWSLFSCLATQPGEGGIDSRCNRNLQDFTSRESSCYRRVSFVPSDLMHDGTLP